MAKGSNFEREVCKQLSEWWSGGENDRVFWRSTTSGALATTRAKKGLKTRGHCGDICAVDPSGESLMKLLVIECKRGYQGSTLSEAIEVDPNKGNRKHPVQFLKFVNQAREARQKGCVRFWWLITRRNNRATMLYMPIACEDVLRRVGSEHEDYVSTLVRVWLDGRGIMGVHLDEFLEACPPKIVRRIAVCLTD